MNAMGYVVGAFADPALSLHAAKALRDLCENNRRALSGHIDSFSNLYANLSSIPVIPLLGWLNVRLIPYLLGHRKGQGLTSNM